MSSPFEVATESKHQGNQQAMLLPLAKQIFQLFMSSQSDSTGEFGGGKLGSPLLLRPAGLRHHLLLHRRISGTNCGGTL